MEDHLLKATIPSPTITTASATTYDNLTPLMVLVAVSATILFCCLCLTSFNSVMKKKFEQKPQHISYGEAEQTHQKFGSIFMSYMPTW